MLELKNIEKSFGKKKILRDLSYAFDKKVYGLLGPNGAGKTTLLRCITKLYPIKSGSIEFDGIPISKGNDYLNKIGYLPQKFGAFKELKVTDMLELLANLKGVSKADCQEKIEKCISLVNLEDKAEEKVSSLSGGMLRRLGIAQAIISDPEVIIFDEPTAGLDPEERIRFKNIISTIKKDCTIIISTHIVEDFEAICDSIIVMDKGDFVVDGSCEDIKNRAVGKVYELAESELPAMNGTYYVQKRFERDGVNKLRCLSADKQEFEVVSPTIEDGYICTLKNL